VVFVEKSTGQDIIEENYNSFGMECSTLWLGHMETKENVM